MRRTMLAIVGTIAVIIAGMGFVAILIIWTSFAIDHGPIGILISPPVCLGYGMLIFIFFAIRASIR